MRRVDPSTMRAACVLLAAVLTAAAWAAHAKGGGSKDKGGQEAAGKTAQSDSQKHFDAGVELYMGKKYAEALEEFRKAYEISGHWAIRYNIASCYLELGKVAEAVDELWRFLDEGKDQIDEARREEALELIGQAMKKVARVKIIADTTESQLVIDGKEMAWPEPGQPVYVSPGVHDIEVKQEDKESWKSRMDLKAGGEVVVEVNLKAMPKSKGKGAAGGPILKGKFETVGYTLEGPKGHRTGGKEKEAGLLLKEKKIQREWFWVSAAGLIATSLAAAALTVTTEVTRQDLEDIYAEFQRRESNGTLTQEYYDWATGERRDLLDRGNACSQAQAALWIAAGFFAAATVALAIFTFGKEKPKVGAGFAPLRDGGAAQLVIEF
jgi:hypothetical protein